MNPYIIVFILCLFFLSIKSKTLLGKFALAIVALLPLLLLAAFRDASVGTDTSAYLIIRENINGINDIGKYDMEPLYSILNVLSNNWSFSQQFFLFIIELLIVFPIFITTLKLKDQIQETLVFFIFLMTLYNVSFNMIRQSIAISFVLLSLPYLLEKKYLKHYLLCAIAIGFHYTAIFALIISVLYFITQRYSIKKYQGQYLILLIITIVLFSQFPLVFNLISRHSALLSSYSGYVSNIKDGDVGYSTLIVKLFILCSIILSYRFIQNSRHLHLLDFFLVCSVVDVILNFIGIFSTYLARITWYTFIVSFISIPYCFKLRNGKYQLLNISTIFIYMAYWFYIFVVTGSSETIPYTSKILGIM
jgi:hypothetical protein